MQLRKTLGLLAVGLLVAVSSAGRIGRTTSNEVRPGLLSIRIDPACRLTIPDTMHSPSPVPLPMSLVV